MRRRSRRTGAFLVSAALAVLLAELIVRGYFASLVGPRVLLYGTPWERNRQSIPAFAGLVQSHRNTVGQYSPYSSDDPSAYSKYFPREEKVTESPDRKEVYPVRINNQGFRGADFAIEKAPGTIRVLTLGSSSTFGYHDRDDETYPYLLERILNERAGDRARFEVINFAIPHATSQNILAMFLAEGSTAHPDFVTFYEGANASAIVDHGPPGPGSELGCSSSSTCSRRR
jgi:hypothetical protein